MLIWFAISMLTLPSVAQQLASPTPAAAQPETASRFGKVHFPVSCNPEAQAKFDLAVAMVHSFFYPEAGKAFNRVLDADPKCAMAYWGIAISQRPNPLVPPFPPAALKAGLEAAQKGLSANPPTQREKDWLAAIQVFFTDYDKQDQPTRARLYTNAMQKMYEVYPQDTEAAVFYALALNESTDLADKSYGNQLKAAVILEKVLARQPEHPGAIHYLIHSYDYGPMAHHGLDAARKYAAIAPAAPHALHMPAHIYSMMGMWEDSIKSNQASLDCAREYAAKNFQGAAHPSEPHLLDFMEYAYLQLGQDKQAKALVDRAASIQKFPMVMMSSDTGLSAVPARYALERGAWAEAAALEIRPSTYGYAEAMTRFARAIGSARTGNLPASRAELEKLQALRQAYAAKPDSTYWGAQTEILTDAAAGWIARAEGRDDEALKLLRTAADLEDGSEKQVAMENRLFPVREQLAYMLLELNKPKQALAEFDLSSKSTPNRLRGLYGAAKAAQLAGDSATARARYQELLTLTRNAESERPEIADAKKFMVVAQK
jgi:tetratricopeptide (TPR) repeat protein